MSDVNVRNGCRTVAVKVCFSFNFAVVFDFNLFPVPPRNAKSIGDVLTDRQDSAINSMIFFLLFIARIAY